MPLPIRTTPDRPSSQIRRGVENIGKGESSRYAHSLGLSRSAAGDLLDAELVELGLQLLELLLELILVLAPELTSLDLGRLFISISDEFSRLEGKGSDGEHTMVAALLCVLSALRIEDVRSGQIVIVGLGLSELAALDGHVTLSIMPCN